MRELPESLKIEIADDPYYFVYQGGADGTFAHEEYLDKYGKWQPEASALAAHLLKTIGATW